MTCKGSNPPISARYEPNLIRSSFGLAPQTIQGADLLAKSVGARVLLPDVFFGYNFIVFGF